MEPKSNEVPKEDTIPKSIRLTRRGFDSLKILEAREPGRTRGAVASDAMNLAVRKSAAAPTIKSRLLDSDVLFPLQAAASDIKIGLQSFRHELYQTNKSARGADAATRAEIYAGFAKKIGHTFSKADSTLDALNKEATLHDLLSSSKMAKLENIAKEIRAEKPTDPNSREKKELLLLILDTILA